MKLSVNGGLVVISMFLILTMMDYNNLSYVTENLPFITLLRVAAHRLE